MRGAFAVCLHAVYSTTDFAKDMVLSFDYLS
jgi:hypothetical protein